MGVAGERFGLVVARFRSTSYSTPSSVNTGMGDRSGVQLPVPETYLAVFISFHSSNCRSLTKRDAKFHKVVQRHYLGEVENFILYGKFT